MAVDSVIKTIGSTGDFSTIQLWEDGAPADLTTAEKVTADTFAGGPFTQGENLTFTGSGATGTFLDSDHSTYIAYGITLGNPANGDVITGGTSGATCNYNDPGTPSFTGIVWEGQLQNQEFTGANPIVTFSGVTTSTSAKIQLYCVAGAAFGDHVNAATNPLKYNASVGAGIRGTSANARCVVVTSDNVECFDLQITNDVAGTATGAWGLLSGGANARLEGCICEGRATSTSTAAGVINTNNSTNTVINCLVIQLASGADHIVGGGGSTYTTLNCTFVAPDDLATAPTGIIATTGTPTYESCALFAGDSTKAIVVGAGTPTFDHCYSDISGTSGVTQATYANQFHDVNLATRDFKLLTGSDLIGNATNNAAAADDILNVTRGGQHDVGAHEYFDIVDVSLIGAWLGQARLGNAMIGLRWI